jgi:hypothetical protein
LIDRDQVLQRGLAGDVLLDGLLGEQVLTGLTGDVLVQVFLPGAHHERLDERVGVLAAAEQPPLGRTGALP